MASKNKTGQFDSLPFSSDPAQDGSALKAPFSCWGSSVAGWLLFVQCVYCVLSLAASWTWIPGTAALLKLADQKREISLCLELW